MQAQQQYTHGKGHTLTPIDKVIYKTIKHTALLPESWALRTAAPAQGKHKLWSHDIIRASSRARANKSDNINIRTNCKEHNG